MVDTLKLWCEIYGVRPEMAIELIKRVWNDEDHPTGVDSVKCLSCLHYDQSLLGGGCYRDFENCVYRPIGGISDETYIY